MIDRSLNLLYPPFAKALLRGLADAHAKGIMAYIYEAFRPIERQAFLFAQGRTTAGPIVTRAKPGESWHQYGVAVDLVFDKLPNVAGMQWTWEGGHADAHGDQYDKLAEIIKAQGIQWLGDQKIERAHFQSTYGLTIMQAQQITAARGILGLWQEFDKRQGG